LTDFHSRKDRANDPLLFASPLLTPLGVARKAVAPRIAQATWWLQMSLWPAMKRSAFRS